ncbi:uncharacterized protein CIMG_08783 [Coccidioides immitis RS]|uniref:Uncharacterized protein n=1 Tax=Coccidioides immitis (strain RS) TaxID=246410 RepID=J3K669_COCIM|nr:uncharacterized protein CIMG_08783 [Coccidioides immitis RS]EAS30037.3 hypothetical protein CIMG_08783 [Coccidioides immitis RS]TPX22171.1 hypothetical protein DIZ76_014036 [Coccidioides immitis]
MQATSSKEAIGQESKNRPQSLRHFETAGKKLKVENLGTILNRIFRLQTNRLRATSETGDSRDFQKLVATFKKQKCCSLKRIIKKMRKRAVPEPLVKLRPTQGPTNNMNDENDDEPPLLALCSHTFTQDERDRLSKKHKELKQHERDQQRQRQQEERDNVNPATEEQVVSLARREQEAPNSFITSPVLVPAIEEPELQVWSKGLNKRPYRSADPTMLNPTWAPKRDSPSPLCPLCPPRRSASRRSRNGWSEEDLSFRDLLRSMLDDETLERVLREDAATEEGEAAAASASSKMENEKLREIMYEMVDNVVDKTVDEVRRVEARSRERRLSRDSEAGRNKVTASQANGESESTGSLTALHSCEPKEINELLHGLLNDLLEIVIADEVDLSDDVRQRVKETVLFRKRKLFGTEE